MMQFVISTFNLLANDWKYHLYTPKGVGYFGGIHSFKHAEKMGSGENEYSFSLVKLYKQI